MKRLVIEQITWWPRIVNAGRRNRIGEKYLRSVDAILEAARWRSRKASFRILIPKKRCLGIIDT